MILSKGVPNAGTCMRNKSYAQVGIHEKISSLSRFHVHNLILINPYAILTENSERCATEVANLHHEKDLKVSLGSGARQPKGGRPACPCAQFRGSFCRESGFTYPLEFPEDCRIGKPAGLV